MIVRITSKFGSIDSVHHTPHSGIDIALNEGTPLRTFQEGVVKDVLGYGDKNVGNGVIIQHEDGTQAIYGHLSKVNVREGEYVHKGETFAESGNTGHSTGEHLHFGMKDANGNVIDPTPYIDEVSKNIGESHWWDTFINNGQVAHVEYFSIWEWLGGKVQEVTINNAIDFIADIALAFPILAVAGGSVYVLINMFSKSLAKWGAIGTVIYGLLVIKGLNS